GAGPYFSQLCDKSLPRIPHVKPHFSAVREGQIQALAKGVGCLIAASGIDIKNDDMPPGCCLVKTATAAVASSGGKLVLSCSDKLAKWNVLGLQGKRLTQWTMPVYLTSLVIGRKFSRRVCERALCCRMCGLEAHRERGRKQAALPPLFHIQHPVLMTTSMKFDDGIYTVCAEASKTEGGADFSEARCLIWGPSMPSTEVINCHSGRLLDQMPSNAATEVLLELAAQLRDLPGGERAVEQYHQAKLMVQAYFMKISCN
ncbi:hypothetical protein CYMTET_27353, partial [Cymbomonas tetramitiformis]